MPFQKMKYLGFEMENANTQIPDDNRRRGLTGNICSYIKACEQIDYSQYDGVIFTDCCNSTQRLYDYIRYKYSDLFVFMLEISHRNGEILNINTFYRAMGIGSTSEFPIVKHEMAENNMQLKKIMIVSSCLHENYKTDISALFSDYMVNFHDCNSSPRGDLQMHGEIVSCPRLTNYFDYMEKRMKSTTGVIFIITQRCDHIMFAQQELIKHCKRHHIPYLLVEEEYSIKMTERSKIRYEAFKECLQLEKNNE